MPVRGRADWPVPSPQVKTGPDLVDGQRDIGSGPLTGAPSDTHGSVSGA
jgi:hypothetical protein